MIGADGPGGSPRGGILGASGPGAGGGGRVWGCRGGGRRGGGGAARHCEARVRSANAEGGPIESRALNVGLPREVEWESHAVLTSIFKEPVERRLRVSSLNFEGDEQSD